MAIEVKELAQLKLMRKAGLVVANTLKLIEQSAQIGNMVRHPPSLATTAFQLSSAPQ